VKGNPLFDFDYTREAMIARAEAAPWLHARHLKEHFRDHKTDWAHRLSRALTSEEYEALPRLTLQAAGVRVFAYEHKGMPQWGFYGAELTFGKTSLDRVAVVYDLKQDAIITCFYATDGVAYFEDKTYAQEVC
jgi:hypothetical protein